MEQQVVILQVHCGSQTTTESDARATRTTHEIVVVLATRPYPTPTASPDATRRAAAKAWLRRMASATRQPSPTRHFVGTMLVMSGLLAGILVLYCVVAPGVLPVVGPLLAAAFVGEFVQQFRQRRRS
ncbi:hypothetical protein [Actinokineospora inagensis]|uniref:hypothetical protein n=1 Tax=Actinokineospora inagensis TaxID=103730 RepID=UPI00041D14CB|nr:hypothetical protein [Actinokineospora inagensis]